jgi:uncharacterized protein YukE
MSKGIKVNWTSLKKMGDTTIKTSQDFEEARQNFQDIINSLPECWEGIDSSSFMVNCNNFLNDLKKDTLYFGALGEYFTKGSQVYSGVVNTHSEKMKKMNQTLDEEQSKYKFVDEQVVNSKVSGGVYNAHY